MSLFVPLYFEFNLFSLEFFFVNYNIITFCFRIFKYFYTELPSKKKISACASDACSFCIVCQDVSVQVWHGYGLLTPSLLRPVPGDSGTPSFRMWCYSVKKDEISRPDAAGRKAYTLSLIRLHRKFIKKTGFGWGALLSRRLKRPWGRCTNFIFIYSFIQVRYLNVTRWILDCEKSTGFLLTYSVVSINRRFTVSHSALKGKKRIVNILKVISRYTNYVVAVMQTNYNTLVG